MPSISDLSEHTGTLIALVSTFFILCVALVGVIYKIALTLKTDILSMISKLDNRITDIWDEISKIRDKQALLREEIPKQYMRIDGPGYVALTDSLDRIERHLDQFSADCRNGKCPAGRIRP